jgi:hypothetical protein
MFKQVMKVTTIALALSSFTASGEEFIDLFTDDQALVQVVNTTGSNFAPGANIIGGQRDIQVTAGDDVRASAEVLNDQLLIASSDLGGSGNKNFNVTVQWDGGDSASTLDTDGLGGIDFSGLTGFSADILSSDGSGSFDITIYDMSANMATISLPFIPVAAMSPQSFTIPFALFTGLNALLDLSSIGSIQLSLDGVGDTDIRVAAINAVPEPSGIALMGLSLLGLAVAARKKNRA